MIDSEVNSYNSVLKIKGQIDGITWVEKLQFRSLPFQIYFWFSLSEIAFVYYIFGNSQKWKFSSFCRIENIYSFYMQNTYSNFKHKIKMIDNFLTYPQFQNSFEFKSILNWCNNNSSNEYEFTIMFKWFSKLYFNWFLSFKLAIQKTK